MLSSHLLLVWVIKNEKPQVTERKYRSVAEAKSPLAPLFLRGRGNTANRLILLLSKIKVDCEIEAGWSKAEVPHLHITFYFLSK